MADETRTEEETDAKVEEYIVDAHTLIWYVAGNPRLGAKAFDILHHPDSLLLLPVIALAEVCWAVERGKCAIPSAVDLLRDVDGDPRITIVPLDRAILDISLTLPTIGEMHDRQIAATALYRASQGVKVALLTRDENITVSYPRKFRPPGELVSRWTSNSMATCRCSEGMEERRTCITKESRQANSLPSAA